MQTENQCNGKYCKGKKLPTNRFGKNNKSKNGFYSLCKMCNAHKNNDNFVPGICVFCSKAHDCMYGTGLYCNKTCSSLHINKCDPKDYIHIMEKSHLEVEEDLTLSKICIRSYCKFYGQEQPITNFYKCNTTLRSGNRRNECADCNRRETNEGRATLRGYLTCALNSARTRATRNNMEINIDVDFILEMYENQNEKCNISKMPLTHIVGGSETRDTAKNPFNMSIDRIDSNKGYTKDNVQLICVWVQTAKSDWDQDSFKNWILIAAENILNNGTKIHDIAKKDITPQIIKSEKHPVIQKTRESKKCSSCKKDIADQSTMCIDCYKKNTKKLTVSRNDLYDLVHIQKLSFATIGTKFGVSDVAIRKRCLVLDIDIKRQK